MSLPELAFKSVGLLMVVALAAVALRGASAAVRHRVWALGFVALAALPFLAVRLPVMEVAMVTAMPPPAAYRINLAQVRPETTTAFAPSPGTAGPTVPTIADEARNETFPWIPLLESMWAAGAGLSLAAFGIGLLSTHALARRQGEELAADPSQGVPPHTRVFRTSAVDVPLTFGGLRPTILLPVESVEWDEARLRAVLLHEGAHIRRGDWTWLAFSRLVCAAYWANPLVWWAAARMRAEGELAADDAVLRAGVDGPSYAHALVELVATIRDGRRGAALFIVERATLRRRVSEILSAATPRSPLTRRAAVGAGLLAAAVAMPIAAVHLGSRPVTFRDGILDLGAGGEMEVVAITSMDGGVVRSWDARGAPLSRLWPVDASTRQTLSGSRPPLDSDEKLRYVFVRTRDGSAPETSERLGGDPLTLWPYSPSVPIWGHDYQVGYDLRDARGGSYRVLCLVVPKGRRTADLYAKAWSADWRLDAYLKYDENGTQVGMMNSTLALELSAGVSKYEKSAIRMDLPEPYAHRRTLIRANGKPFAEFDGGTGPRRAVSGDVSASSIRTVELFSAPIWDVRLADLPLDPDLAAVHAPRPFRPAGMVVAEGGGATLSDGTTLRLVEVADGLWHRWSPDGRPLPGRTSSASEFFRLKDPNLRHVRVAFARTHRNDVSLDAFYDGEGRGLPTSNRFTSIGPQEDVVGLSPLVPRALRRTDLVVRSVVGKPRTVAGGDLIFGEARPGGGWAATLHAEEGKEARLTVVFPSGFADPAADESRSWVPLDARGVEVGRSRSTSWDGKKVEITMDPAEARRVRRIELRSRPYGWARFPDVRLYSR